MGPGIVVDPPPQAGVGQGELPENTPMSPVRARLTAVHVEPEQK